MRGAPLAGVEKKETELTCRTFVALLTMAAVAGLFTFNTNAAAQTPSDEDDVLAVVQQFFDSMASADTLRAQEVLTPDGQYYGVREQSDSVFVKRRTHREYLESLPASAGAALERMWEPQVLIHGRIAVVWVSYDFHVDGEFRHCGVDAFSLIKTGTGWKIAGTVYTVEPDGCAPSPLGPVRLAE